MCSFYLYTICVRSREYRVCVNSICIPYIMSVNVFFLSVFFARFSMHVSLVYEVVYKYPYDNTKKLEMCRTIVIRTHRIHQNLFVPLFLQATFGPDYCMQTKA